MDFGILGIDYLYIGITMQGTPVFLISIIASIIIALKNGKIKNIYPLFFIIGAVTCYTDFLTVPIITLGLPLTTYFLCIQKERNVKILEALKIIFLTSINWGIGYALIWFTKWGIVDIFYGKGIIKTSISQVLYRSVAKEINFIEVLKCNLEIIDSNIPVMIFLCIAIALFRLIKNNGNFGTATEVVERAFPYLIILIMPFAWYFIVQEHSYEHAFFTYRNLLLLLTGMPLIALKLTDRTNKSS